MSRAMGADVILNPEEVDPATKISRLTEKRVVDVAVDAVGRQEVFANTMQGVRPGGMVSNQGGYGGLQELTRVDLTPDPAT